MGEPKVCNEPVSEDCRAMANEPGSHVILGLQAQDVQGNRMVLGISRQNLEAAQFWVGKGPTPGEVGQRVSLGGSISNRWGSVRGPPLCNRTEVSTATETTRLPGGGHS